MAVLTAGAGGSEFVWRMERSCDRNMSEQSSLVSECFYFHQSNDTWHLRYTEGVFGDCTSKHTLWRASGFIKL